MKKLLPLLLVLGGLQTALAQVGFRAGATFSKAVMVDKDNIPFLTQYVDEFNETMKSRTGLQAGFTFRIPISEAVFAEPEVHFTQLGYRHKVSQAHLYYYASISGYGESEVAFTTNYLQAPFYLGYKIPVNKVTILLKAGPFAGFWLSGKIRQELTENLFSQTDTRTNTKYVKFAEKEDHINYFRFDAGWAAALGLEVPVGDRSLTLDVRYNHGIVNYARYNANPTSPWHYSISHDAKTFNRHFGVGIGYQISKPKKQDSNGLESNIY